MLLLVAVSAGFASCSDDDDDEDKGGGNDSIVGTWEYQEYDDGYLYECYQFFEDGTFTCYVIESSGDFEQSASGSETGTYKLQGSKITLYHTDGRIRVYDYYLKGDKLIIAEIVYTRVED